MGDCKFRDEIDDFVVWGSFRKEVRIELFVELDWFESAVAFWVTVGLDLPLDFDGGRRNWESDIVSCRFSSLSSKNFWILWVSSGVWRFEISQSAWWSDSSWVISLIEVALSSVNVLSLVCVPVDFKWNVRRMCVWVLCGEGTKSVVERGEGVL